MRTLTFQALERYLDTAPLFRKIAFIHLSDIEIVTPMTERDVETYVNGKLETTRFAKAGDLILRGPKGEKYVSSKKSFDALHAPDPQNPDNFHAKHVVRAILLKEDFIIRASWGEDMVISAGGVAVVRLNDGKFYGNQADTFNQTYWRVSPSGKDICPLTLPLEEQMGRVEQHGAFQHKEDLQDRINFQKFPNRSSCEPKARGTQGKTNVQKVPARPSSIPNALWTMQTFHRQGLPQHRWDALNRINLQPPPRRPFYVPRMS